MPGPAEKMSYIRCTAIQAKPNCVYNQVAYFQRVNVHTILVVTALGLAIFSLVKPQWPLLAVSVILVCVTLLIGR
jgi:ABC-type transport system involved in multi-copper enzyme maturation permease subunit